MDAGKEAAIEPAVSSCREVQNARSRSFAQTRAGWDPQLVPRDPGRADLEHGRSRVRPVATVRRLVGM